LVANLALTTEEKGRGELRRWREAGWLGRTKSTEIVIPDLKKNGSPQEFDGTRIFRPLS